jgi:hypothetical protein
MVLVASLVCVWLVATLVVMGLCWAAARGDEADRARLRLRA